MLLASTTPQFAVGLVAGVVADQYSRKAILIITSVVSAAALLTMWLLACSNALDLAVLVSLVVVLAACSALLIPSAAATVPLIVNRADLRSATSLLTATEQLAQIPGPAAAGILIATWDAQAWFLLSAVSFAAAAVLLATIRPTKPERSAQRQPGVRQSIRDIVEAGQHVYRTRWLRTGLLAGAIANLALVAPLAIIVPVIINNEQMGAATLGWYGTTLALGTVTGALAGSRLAKINPMQRILTALLASGLIAIPAGFAPTAAVILSVGLLLGFTLAIFEVIWNSYQLANVPDHLLGKILSWDLWLSFTSRSLGLGVVGGLGVATPALTMTISGLVLAGVMVTLLLHLRAPQAVPSVPPSPNS